MVMVRVALINPAQTNFKTSVNWKKMLNRRVSRLLFHDSSDYSKINPIF